MKFRRTTLGLTAILSAAALSFGSPAQAQPAPAPSPQALATHAMQLAAQGSTGELEAMLASGQAPAMRAEVEKWVSTHPSPPPPKPRESDVARPNTGQYDYYCTGYNGQTIGWNGKTFHACHGYLDK